MIVGKRESGALYLPMFLLEQPGCETDQAGLAAAVAAPDLQRVPRPQIEAQAIEQQAAAASQSCVIEAKQCGQGTLASSAWMSSSLRPK